MEEENQNTIEKYVRSVLAIQDKKGSNTTIEADLPDISEHCKNILKERFIHPDFMISDNNTIYCVEAKSRGSIGTIARINLYSDLIKRKLSTKYEIIPVLAVKTIDPGESTLAEEAGIRVIKLPWNITVKSADKNRQTKNTVKITAEKSWKIASGLLKEPSSIRQVSKRKDVSYGWAHKTVQSLLDQNIAEKDGYLIKIIDYQKLLNGIAWERPMKNLLYREISVDYENSHQAATSITANLDTENIPHAFTGRTAGGLYTGYAFRHDTADLYLEKADIAQFNEHFESDDKSGVKIRIYTPDRDTFSSTRIRESVRLASPEITLLDLAGMGYAERDLTMEMLKQYGRL